MHDCLYLTTPNCVLKDRRSGLLITDFKLTPEGLRLRYYVDGAGPDWRSTGRPNHAAWMSPDTLPQPSEKHP